MSIIRELLGFGFMSNHGDVEDCPEEGCGKRRLCLRMSQQTEEITISRTRRKVVESQVTVPLVRCERCMMAQATPIVCEHFHNADEWFEDGIEHPDEDLEV